MTVLAIVVVVVVVVMMMMLVLCRWLPCCNAGMHTVHMILWMMMRMQNDVENV